MTGEVADREVERAEAEANRLRRAIVRLTNALAGEYGHPERTNEEIVDDREFIAWLGLMRGDLLIEHGWIGKDGRIYENSYH